MKNGRDNFRTNLCSIKFILVVENETCTNLLNILFERTLHLPEARRFSIFIPKHNRCISLQLLILIQHNISTFSLPPTVEQSPRFQFTGHPITSHKSHRRTPCLSKKNSQIPHRFVLRSACPKLALGKRRKSNVIVSRKSPKHVRRTTAHSGLE